MTSTGRSAELRTGSSDCAALLRCIADGDEPAFATFYNTTCGVIYGLLLRMLGNSAAAEHVMVAVYQEVWERAAIYDGREKLITWLVTMAHSRAVARLRVDSDSRPPQPSLESAGRLPRAGSKTDEIPSGEQKFAQAALVGLSPEQWQIIELAYFSGLRQDEIAARLGLSLQAVQSGLRAGMMGLRDALEFHQLNAA